MVNYIYIYRIYDSVDIDEIKAIDEEDAYAQIEESQHNFETGILLTPQQWEFLTKKIKRYMELI